MNTTKVGEKMFFTGKGNLYCAQGLTVGKEYKIRNVENREESASNAGDILITVLNDNYVNQIVSHEAFSYLNPKEAEPKNPTRRVNYTITITEVVGPARHISTSTMFDVLTTVAAEEINKVLSVALN